MRKESVLITASTTLCAPMLHDFEKKNDIFVHLPLEEFTFDVEKEESQFVQDNKDNFSFVIYGNVRNAQFFVNWMNKNNVLEPFKNAVHLALDKPTAEFLEEHSIPAIMPREKAKPIDLLEFMLRISREGKSLYPCTDQKAEEMPGLLQELEMDVVEFSVCKEKSLDSTRLETFRKEVQNLDISAVLFHNRSSVTRIKTAFPDIDLQTKKIISGSPGVTKSLIDLGIEPNYEADGNWYSIGELIEEKFL
ncbi:MAG: uroporphyrinogen-III synthase [Balneolaceae bacterium]